MIKKLLQALSAAPTAETKTIRPELAVAALLVHAARADDDYADSEVAAIDTVLADGVVDGLEAAATLRREAETVEAAAADVVRFTQAIKAAMSEEEREVFLERMWRVVLADGVRDPDENAFMRRLAALLYVPDARSNAARLRAERAGSA